MTGSRVVETRYQSRIGVREDNVAAALEVMSRFAIDRWLLYLPPTMSPVATSTLPQLLEHPAQAIEAFRADGVDQVVSEEKHLGSRAVALVCRIDGAARARFGAPGDQLGALCGPARGVHSSPARSLGSSLIGCESLPRALACPTSLTRPGCCLMRS